MSFQPKRLIFAFAAALLVVVPASQASTVRVVSTGFGGNVPIVISGNSDTDWAGQINITLDGNSMVAFCVDALTPISLSTNYATTVGAPSSFTNGTRNT